VQKATIYMLKYGLLLLCCSGLLTATTINVNSIQPATAAGYQSDQFGHYIGPYQLNTSIGSLQIMCIDLFYGVNPPYTAYVTPISDVPTSPLTTYLSSQTIYEEEVYLYSLIVKAPDLTTQAEIQDAAWALTDSSFLTQLQNTNDARATASLTDLTNVLTMQTNGTLATALNYALYDVITNTAGVGSNTQEFIYLDPRSATPEPASLGLMGASLVGLGLILRRVKRNRATVTIA
jgi:PEP-CTERM motif